MDRPDAAPEHLFVYGTLRSDAGGAMHARLMHGAQRVGPASIRGRLYHAGRYPAAVASDDAADRITGELYAIDAAAAGRLLASLDAYEAIDEAHPALSLFRRTIVAAEREDGMRVPAWVYLYNRPVDSLPRVTSGDWLRRAS
ncbi:MAG TPA: gamma-glutamylcyclotransferase family protein [Longimicrobium sp.]|nr:gamma-glutamylcyclotransferase family protein [Longimicrobium sp.]